MRLLVLLLVFCSCLHRQGVGDSDGCREFFDSFNGGDVLVKYVDCSGRGLIQVGADG